MNWRRGNYAYDCHPKKPKNTFQSSDSFTSTRTTTAAEKSRQIFTLPTDTYEVRANFRSVQLTAWKALMWVKTYSDFGRFCYLNIPCFRINTVYYFNLYEFLKRRIHALVGRLKNRCFRWFPAAMFVPQGTQTRRLRTIKFKKHN